MHTRMMVCAFLTYGGEALMLHRGMHKEIAPGMWSGVGGHIEADEHTDPLRACLREIEEESGISKEMIESLRLRYIVLFNKGTEISQCFYFIGSVMERIEPPPCDEGALFWVPMERLASLEMSFFVEPVVLHWLSHRDRQEIYLLGINHQNNIGSWITL